MRKCIELAAALTEAYYRPLSEGCDPLSSGVLVSMCMPNQYCVVLPNEDHLAASWIHETIGPAVVPGATHGMIFDYPTSASIDILCVAPVDLVSDARDDLGCGPFRLDPVYGSVGKMNAIQKYFYRRGIVQYKNLNFGKDLIDWAEIPCNNFFNIAVHLEAIYNISDTSTATPIVSLLQSQYQAIVGHAVCNASRPPKLPLLPVYAGNKAWPANEWRQLLAQQKILQETYPLLWNEFVIRLPDQLNRVVQAVFYRSRYDQEDVVLEARTLARLLKRPLLEMHESSLGNITFVCKDELPTATTS